MTKVPENDRLRSTTSVYYHKTSAMKTPINLRRQQTIIDKLLDDLNERVSIGNDDLNHHHHLRDDSYYHGHLHNDSNHHRHHVRNINRRHSLPDASKHHHHLLDDPHHLWHDDSTHYHHLHEDSNRDHFPRHDSNYHGHLHNDSNHHRHHLRNINRRHSLPDASKHHHHLHDDPHHLCHDDSKHYHHLHEDSNRDHLLRDDSNYHGHLHHDSNHHHHLRDKSNRRHSLPDASKHHHQLHDDSNHHRHDDPNHRGPNDSNHLPHDDSKHYHHLHEDFNRGHHSNYHGHLYSDSNHLHHLRDNSNHRHSLPDVFKHHHHLHDGPHHLRSDDFNQYLHEDSNHNHHLNDNFKHHQQDDSKHQHHLHEDTNYHRHDNSERRYHLHEDSKHHHHLRDHYNPRLHDVSDHFQHEDSSHHHHMRDESFQPRHHDCNYRRSDDSNNQPHNEFTHHHHLHDDSSPQYNLDDGSKQHCHLHEDSNHHLNNESNLHHHRSGRRPGSNRSPRMETLHLPRSDDYGLKRHLLRSPGFHQHFHHQPTEELVEPPDGGYGFVIVFASFMCNCVVDGILYTAGQSFIPAWEQAFQRSSGATAWVVSLLSGCYLLAGPIASAMANHWGCRVVAWIGAGVAVLGFLLSLFAPNLIMLYVTFGALGGIGFGMVYLPSIVIVSYYFKARRALATGAAVCGAGIGMIAFAPLLDYLQSEWTWQQTLLLTAGIAMELLVFVALFRPLTPTQTQKGENVADKKGEVVLGNWRQNILTGLKSMLNVELLKSPCFLLLAIGGFLTMTCFFVPFAFLKRAAMDARIPEEQAAFLVSAIGIVNIFGRILCGWLSDQPRVDALWIHNGALAIAGLATIFVPFLTQYWMFILYCVVFGIGTASFASLRSVVCAELLGLERLSTAYGYLLLFMGAAALIGAPLAGTLSDITGSYDLSFYVMGTLLMCSGLIGVPLRRISEWELNRMQLYVREENANQEEQNGNA